MLMRHSGSVVETAERTARPAWIRDSRDRVTMAHAGVGSGSHLCNMLIQSALGVKVTEVAYRGTGPALNDLVGGQIDLLCDQTTNAIHRSREGGSKRLPSPRPNATNS